MAPWRAAGGARAGAQRSDLTSFGLKRSFGELLEKIGVIKSAALEAQRIACLPPDELEAFCARARKEAAGQLPTFAELLRAARPWWYQESRREKHRAIYRRDAAIKAAVSLRLLYRPSIPARTPSTAGAKRSSKTISTRRLLMRNIAAWASASGQKAPRRTVACVH